MPKLTEFFNNLFHRSSSAPVGSSLSTTTSSLPSPPSSSSLPSSASQSQAKSKSTLRTDAAPINDSHLNSNSNESDDDEQQQQNNQLPSYSSVDLQRQLTTTSIDDNGTLESLPPLKQHILATQALLLPPQQQPIPSGHTLQHFSSESNNNFLGGSTVNNIQSQNLIQLSHINGVHIGNAYNFNSTNANNPIVSKLSNNYNGNGGKGDDGCDETTVIPKKIFKKTKTIEAMMKSDEVLEHRMIDIIATHMENWKDIARTLNYSDGQIQHFEADNHISGTKEIIYQLLLEWTQNAEDATLGKIVRILWKSKNQQTVYHLREVWKTMRQ